MVTAGCPRSTAAACGRSSACAPKARLGRRGQRDDNTAAHAHACRCGCRSGRSSARRADHAARHPRRNRLALRRTSSAPRRTACATSSARRRWRGRGRRADANRRPTVKRSTPVAARTLPVGDDLQRPALDPAPALFAGAWRARPRSLLEDRIQRALAKAAPAPASAAPDRFRPRAAQRFVEAAARGGARQARRAHPSISIVSGALALRHMDVEGAGYRGTGELIERVEGRRTSSRPVRLACERPADAMALPGAAAFTSSRSGRRGIAELATRLGSSDEPKGRSPPARTRSFSRGLRASLKPG